MIVFDITDKQSFHDATTYWYAEIKNSCPSETQILLVGNKCDLDMNRAVTMETVQAFLDQNKSVEYVETSAKTAEHIEEAFQQIARMLVLAYNKSTSKPEKKKKKNQEEEQPTAGEEGVKLGLAEGSKKSNKKYCCY
jgi:GTPase SAR1 family protein